MRVLLGVTGSIACYKSYDLLRELIRLGHEVTIVLTQGAEKFIRPETFHYLGAKEVYTFNDDFKAHSKGPVLHVSLVKEIDCAVLFPLSANTLSALAQGRAEDLLQSLFLVSTKLPWLVFPAMNTGMLHHPRVEQNFQTLRQLGNVTLFPTEKGLLACLDEGEGKLLSVDTAAQLIDSFPLGKASSSTILLNAGATISPLDPIRYMTNPSSGLTGFHVTKEFLRKGYRVIAVVGENTRELFSKLAHHPSLSLHFVKTTQDMSLLIHQFFPECSAYISSAAIADWGFEPQGQKMKKSKGGESLSLVPQEDILASVIAMKKAHQKIIGFAAEAPLTEEVILNKVKSKPVDLLVANEVSNGVFTPMKGFVQDHNDYVFYRQGKIEKPISLTKLQLAKSITQFVENSARDV